MSLHGIVEPDACEEITELEDQAISHFIPEPRRLRHGIRVTFYDAVRYLANRNAPCPRSVFFSLN